MDLPRSFTIRESSHRILNPFTAEKLATLGRALHLRAGMSVLDLACGKGELLCTWARDHGIRGTGVDVSTVFTAAARALARNTKFLSDSINHSSVASPASIGWVSSSMTSEWQLPMADASENTNTGLSG